MNATNRVGQLVRCSAVLAVAMLSVGCAESEFDLAEDSRLPAWFNVPEGKTRADVKVHVIFYIVGRPTVQGDFVLRNSSGRTIAKATGDVRNTHGAISFPDLMIGDRHRQFDVITVRGVAEVFEYRRGPLVGQYPTAVLYVCDEPEIRDRLGVPVPEDSHASH